MDERTRTVIKSYFPGVNHFGKLPDPVKSRTNQVVIEHNIDPDSFSNFEGKPIFNISYHVFEQFEGKFILYAYPGAILAIGRSGRKTTLCPVQK